MREGSFESALSKKTHLFKFSSIEKKKNTIFGQPHFGTDSGG